jgi:hypothetical protein
MNTELNATIFAVSLMFIGLGFIAWSIAESLAEWILKKRKDARSKQYNPKYNTSEYTKSLSKQKLHRNNE